MKMNPFHTALILAAAAVAALGGLLLGWKSEPGYVRPASPQLAQLAGIAASPNDSRPNGHPMAADKRYDSHTIAPAAATMPSSTNPAPAGTFTSSASAPLTNKGSSSARMTTKEQLAHMRAAHADTDGVFYSDLQTMNPNNPGNSFTYRGAMISVQPAQQEPSAKGPAPVEVTVDASTMGNSSDNGTNNGEADRASSNSNGGTAPLPTQRRRSLFTVEQQMFRSQWGWTAFYESLNAADQQAASASGQ